MGWAEDWQQQQLQMQRAQELEQAKPKVAEDVRAGGQRNLSAAAKLIQSGEATLGDIQKYRKQRKSPWMTETPSHGYGM